MSRTAAVVLCIVLVLALALWLRRVHAGERDQEGENPMVGLRLMALSLRPEELHLKVPSTGHGVWGSVTDISLKGGTATIVFLSDGTASLYLSSGGGILGGGSHESVSLAGARLLESLEVSFPSLHRGAASAPPAAGL